MEVYGSLSSSGGRVPRTSGHWVHEAGDPHWGMKLSQTRLASFQKREGGKPPISSF